MMFCYNDCRDHCSSRLAWIAVLWCTQRIRGFLKWYALYKSTFYLLTYLLTHVRHSTACTRRLRARYVTSLPTRSTQPCISPGSLNRVPASAGVRRERRLRRVAGDTMWFRVSFRSGEAGCKLLYANPVYSNSSMHHCECVVLCNDIGLQRGRFCARSLASSIPRSSDDRSSWMFFIQVVRGRPGGRVQFSGGGSKMAWLASAFSSIHARCPKTETTGLNDG